MSEAGPVVFELSFNRSVKVRSRDERLTSNAGLLLLREVDHKLGWTESLGMLVPTLRPRLANFPDNVEHLRFGMADWVGRHLRATGRDRAVIRATLALCMPFRKGKSCRPRVPWNSSRTRSQRAKGWPGLWTFAWMPRLRSGRCSMLSRTLESTSFRACERAPFSRSSRSRT